MLTLARKSWTETVIDEDTGEEQTIVHKNDIYAVSYVGADGKTHNTLAAASGLEAYAQTLEAVVETIKGELQLDTEAGIPFFDTVFASTRYADRWAAAVRRAVLAKPFVRSIDNFSYKFYPNLNKLAYELDVTTDIGTITVSS